MFIFYKINKYIKLSPQSNKSKSLILSDSLKSAVIKIQQKVCCEVGCVRRCKPHPLNVTHLSLVSFPQTTSRSQTVKSRQRQMNTTLWSNQGCFIWKTQKTHLCSVSYISDPKELSSISVTVIYNATMGDVISTNLDEGKRGMITGKTRLCYF